MDPDLERAWRRWAAADREEREGEADAAFRQVFQAVPRLEPGPGFAARVQAARERQARRRAWLVRSVAAAGGLTGLAVAVVLLTHGLRLLWAAVDLLVQAAVWMAVALERGADVWTILAQVGRTAGAMMASPGVALVLILIQLVAMAAFYGLQWALASEKESSL